MAIDALNNFNQILNTLNFQAEDKLLKEKGMDGALLPGQEDTLQLSLQAQKALNQKQADIGQSLQEIAPQPEATMQIDAQGNRVQISPQGTELASSQASKVAWETSATVDDASNAVETPKNMVGTATLDSGAKVSIYTTKFAEGEEKPFFLGPNEKVMAEITKADGSTETIAIRANTVISEDDDGNLIVNSGPENYKTSERFELNGTSKNDVIINLNGASNINCGDGNDTIISFKSIKNLNLGAGNNTLYASQDYSIGTVIGGDGDNSITDCSIQNIKLGNGNNKITNSYIATMATGDGNNQIKNSSIGHTAIFGNGDNLIDINSAYKLQVGDGSNNITIRNNKADINANHPGGPFFHDNLLKIGNGNNIVSVDYVTNFEGGNGNNTIAGEIAQLTLGNGSNRIEGKTYFVGDWHLGNGDNYINLKDSSLSVYFGDGDNTLIIENFLGGGISTGKGNNSVEFIGDIWTGVLVHFGSGNNKFIAHGDVSNLEYHGGSGQDIIEINGNLKDSHIFTGLGSDRVTIYKNVYNSLIRSASSLSEISIYGEIIDSRVDKPK